MRTLFISFLGILFLIWSASAQSPSPSPSASPSATPIGNGACWGFPNYQPGLGETSANPLLNQPILTSSSYDWGSVIAGQYATCGVTALTGNAYSPGGQLYCWGDPNYASYLGGNSWFAPSTNYEPSNPASEYAFYPENVAISFGNGQWTMCGIYSPLPAIGTQAAQPKKNNAFCFGSYAASSMIAPSINKKWSPAANSICLGNEYACAIALDGTLYCWGANSGVTGNIPSLSSGTTWLSISCGYNFAVGIDSTTTVHWWPTGPSPIPNPFVNWPSTSKYIPLPATTPTASAVAAGYDFFCTMGAHLHCYGALAVLNSAPAANGPASTLVSVLGALNPSVFALGAFGGCVQGKATGSTPYCWYADYYFTGETATASFPTSPPVPTTFLTLSGGWDYFCGTW